MAQVGLPVWEHLHYVVLINRTELSSPTGIQKVSDPMILLTLEKVRAITQGVLNTGDDQCWPMKIFIAVLPRLLMEADMFGFCADASDKLDQ